MKMVGEGDAEIFACMAEVGSLKNVVEGGGDSGMSLPRVSKH